MSFSQMFDILKKKEKEKIVFVKCGHFYITIEEDPVLLHEVLGLKCICFKNNTCKVGIPTDSLDKYLSKLMDDSIILIKTKEEAKKNSYNIF